MDFSKGKITLKVFISYIILGVLSFLVGHFVFKEIEDYTQLQKENFSDQNKILRIGRILSFMYENDGLARASIQSKSWTTFNDYLAKNDSLMIEIDSLKPLLSPTTQSVLLDSMKILLAKKETNIQSLKTLKSQDTSDAIIEKGLEKLRNLESAYSRLTIKDLVKNPEALDEKTKRVLEDYFSFINQAPPKDSTHSVNEKTLDSVIKASTSVLEKLRTSSSKQQASVSKKEQELITNDLLISQQLRKILSVIESDVLSYSRELNEQREKAIERSRYIITVAAFTGIALVIIFTIIILNDFWKSQRYRKELEKTTSQAQLLANSREQLVNMVSHDLRSPLSSIIGYGELLNKSLGNIEKGRHYVDKIKNVSSYMNRLVEDLLDYSKLESGKIVPEEISFYLPLVINETTQAIQQQYSDKPIELKVQIEDQLDRNNIISDPFRLKQILYNLIGNAYKFTNKGYISVTASTRNNEKYGGAFLTIEVKDTGIGIKPERQHLIFSEFTQVDEQTIKKQEGFGLGLTISRKLTQLLKGDLTFSSEEGKGSTFSFEIPIRFSERTETQTIPKEHVKDRFLNLSAIVIDDDETLRVLISEALNEEGIRVTSFKNAPEALKALHLHDYDLIITDIQLPKMNGFRFVELVRSDKSSYKNQPIIGITGRKDLDKQYYTENGFSKVIFKPFAAEQLVNAIYELRHETPIVENNTEINTGQDNDTLFDLTSLRSFIQDEESMHQVLEVFILDTKKNIDLLYEHAAQEDMTGIKETSHKMLTMFRQIKAHKVVKVLEYLELQHYSTKELGQLLDTLKNEIHSILHELSNIIR